MKKGRYVRSLILVFVSILILSTFSYAQTNVGDAITGTVEGIINDKFEKETGLDKVKDLQDIDAGKIADKTVEYVRGDVPSQLMGNLITQISIGPDKLTDGLFELYLKRRPYSGKVIGDCSLAANEKMREGLLNSRVKAHFSPWVDIAWDAVKSIADGGKSIGDLIVENTKANVEEMIQETLFGEAEPEIETVTIPSYDSCNSMTKITWDPVNMRIIIVTSGNCGCQLIKTEAGPVRLNKFTVTLVAPVTVEDVQIKEENYFIFWKSYNIQAQYKVGNLKVVTNADCDSCDGGDPPPQEEEDKGIFGRILSWLFGEDDGVSIPEDDPIPPPEDTSEKSSEDKELQGIPEPVDGSLDDDKSDPEDTSEDEPAEEDEQKDGGEDKKKSLRCGDKVSINSRSGVPTFSYRETSSSNVNFNCDNSCAPNQICKVLPESVGVDSSSCVYCANVCGGGEFTDISSCQSAAGTGQECVATGKGSCYELKDKAEDLPSPNNCEQAIRFVLDEYVGWFDPSLTMQSAGATFTVPSHRCLSSTDFQKFHIDPIEEGIADPQVQSLCPSLNHTGSIEDYLSGEGKGALCESRTEFTF